MSGSLRSMVVVGLVLLTAACSAAPGTASTPTPSPAPSASPAGLPISHPTGATDVILRFEEGGGFVAPGFLASEAPIFTLFGDGTVIFRNPRLDPPPAIGAIHPFRPFQTAVLDGSQVQVLLATALEEGGLGTAKPTYTDDHIADAPTATFTLDAGGVRKTVSVYALGIDVAGQPDASPRAAFAKLAERLRAFDGDGAIATKVYAPDRYRGVLLEGGAGDTAKPWPWTDLTPADFVVPADPNGPRLPTRILTAAQVKALATTNYEGGFTGPTLTAPDGKTYGFTLRPLLPDEKG